MTIYEDNSFRISVRRGQVYISDPDSGYSWYDSSETARKWAQAILAAAFICEEGEMK